ncbi:ABC-type transport auxiliary lipoprotein family protein [Polaromonas sp.]|uniref:ABC-type transport auxiliary lipoprotein family protein n=1 Tax=Polaromonas sp. TaxID=1869339 RepID=UPI0025DEAE8D|nr:ABC-type transport auxiliary lipoprotein family protein [Polaromonas sp.]
MISVLALVAGCSVIDKPTRATMYDFGPGALSTQALASPPAAAAVPASAPALSPLAIADIATSGGALENQAVLYRLGYVDDQQLRPYSQARWTMPPAQLVRQRMRERLSQQRVVLNAREGVALNRSQNTNLPMLRLELEEFSQLFSAPDASIGLIRLHATLVEITPAGERLVAQRNLSVQRPATSADAAGGVRALTAATDAAIDELDQWLRQMPVR